MQLDCHVGIRARLALVMHHNRVAQEHMHYMMKFIDQKIRAASPLL